MLSLSKQT